VCVFAYGQTGSGKTYTMEGSSDSPGIIPRAVRELFQLLASRPDFASLTPSSNTSSSSSSSSSSSTSSAPVLTLTLSYLQIYNESILDLLVDGNSKSEKLEVRQSPEGNIVPGLTAVNVVSPQEVEQLLEVGKSNRAVASHSLNEASSRSHSLLSLVYRGKNVEGANVIGKLQLVDLAGSERVTKVWEGGDTGGGERLKEAQNINRSLSALGDVINALGNKKATHVPFRNSKLTFLLQDSLIGNSKVLMIVNVSPAEYNVSETVCSLQFAARCKAVELGQAKRNSSSSTGTGGDSAGGGGGGGGGGGAEKARTAVSSLRK